MKADVYSIDGSKNGQIDLPDEIFGIEPNEHVMYQAVQIGRAHV